MYKIGYSDNSSGLWKGYFTGMDVLGHGAVNRNQAAMEAAIAGNTDHHFEA